MYLGGAALGTHISINELKFLSLYKDLHFLTGFSIGIKYIFLFLYFTQEASREAASFNFIEESFPQERDLFWSIGATSPYQFDTLLAWIPSGHSSIVSLTVMLTDNVLGCQWSSLWVSVM